MLNRVLKHNIFYHNLPRACFLLLSDHKLDVLINIHSATSAAKDGNSESAETTLSLARHHLSLIPQYMNEALQSLFHYLSSFRGITVADPALPSSLKISLSCSSPSGLQDLWKCYQSGQLNNVVETHLITEAFLQECQASSIKLMTTIREEDYTRCMNELQQPRSQGTTYFNKLKLLSEQDRQNYVELRLYHSN